MFGRKKYRKGKMYFYLVSGIKKSDPYQSATFNCSATLTILRNMDAAEMYNEVMFHVKKFHNITDENGTFAVYSYHVESN
jgi:hypothetical protein